MFGTDASYGNAHENATNGKHFQGKRSKDLVNWEYVPGIMNNAPNWVGTKLNEFRTSMGLETIDITTATNKKYLGYWAPSARVITVDGVTKVRMYYSIVCDYYIPDGSVNDGKKLNWTERAFIGVAESTNPNGGPSAWKDLGFVVCSSSDKGITDSSKYNRSSDKDWDAYFYFNAIDPTYFIDDDDTHWMIYGSWHSGFALVRINPSTGKVAAVDGSDYLNGNVTGDFEMGNPWADSASGIKEHGYGTRIFARGTSRWQPSEGPELIKHNGYYWLFFANDGLDVPYQTRVVKATSIKGPYYAIEGSEMTNDVDDKRNSSENIYPLVTHPYKFVNNTDNTYGSCYGWVGISHCAIFKNDAGDWMYMSQQRLPKDVSNIAVSNAVMMGGVRRLVWTPKTPSASTSISDLWPIALPERYAALSSTDVTEDEIPGTWQHIKLSYNYANMDKSSDLVLTPNKTMSGALTGTWSFDSDKQQLILSPSSETAIVVSVSRELDWERVPRKQTLVYAGTQSASPYGSYWGKQDSQSSYPFTVFKGTCTVDLGDSPNFYLIQQLGSISVSDSKGTDSNKTYTSTSTGWWKDGIVNTTSLTLADGQSITWTVTVKSDTFGLVLEGTNGINYLDLNLNYAATTDAWGTGSSWAPSDYNSSQYGKQNHTYKIKVTRSGNIYTISAEDEGL